MQSNEILKRVTGIEKSLSEKGLTRPEAHFAANFLDDGKGFTCWVEFRTTSHGRENSEYFKAGRAEEAVSMAEKYATDLPTLQEMRKTEFMAALGKVIDQGREAGIETDFVNPLMETMKKLSENAITYQPRRVVADDLPF